MPNEILERQTGRDAEIRGGGSFQGAIQNYSRRKEENPRYKRPAPSMDTRPTTYEAEMLTTIAYQAY
jgi:hypothetical protein